ncbi:MAG: 4a-hydroxytetrahydrobiopterin dehydratase [Rhodocyclaceae bacterium]
MDATKETTYTDAEIGARLAKELPRWFLEDGSIRRRYRTKDWKGALLATNAIGHLAEAAWHHPELSIGYDHVVVSLSTHSARGVTDKDFALARKIEEVIHWQPGREDGGLEGTPADDPRFGYIDYEY